jgi:hypothetical protein
MGSAVNAVKRDERWSGSLLADKSRLASQGDRFVDLGRGHGQNGGNELAEALRPQMKVLFLSGYTDGALRSLGAGGAPPALLQKPYTVKMLAQKIREFLSK